MAKVFVSYRRSDSSASTGRIADHLQGHFGDSSIFYDVDTIPLGIDFREYLGERLDECDVFLAVMGDDWVHAENTKGGRRLDDPADNVRLEVATALARENIPVIPVLVGTAPMPSEGDLPDPLKALAYRNAIEVRSNADFDGQIGRLIEAIERITGGAKPAAAVAQPVKVAPSPQAAEASPTAAPGGSKKLLLGGAAAAVIAGVAWFALDVADTQQESVIGNDVLNTLADSKDTSAALIERLRSFGDQNREQLSDETEASLDKSLNDLINLEGLRVKAIDMDDSNTVLIGDKIAAYDNWVDALKETRGLAPTDLADASMADRIASLHEVTTLDSFGTYTNCSGLNCSGPKSSFKMGSTIHLHFSYRRSANANANEKLDYEVTVGDTVRRERTLDVSGQVGQRVDYFTASPVGELTLSMYNSEDDLIWQQPITVTP